MKQKFISTLFLLLAALPARSAEFRAGAATIDITPQKLPIRVAGNLTETWADKVHDPLHVRALVLDDGTTRLAIAVVDSCMVGREVLDEAKAAAARATRIPVEHMLISSTHTHSAPPVMGCHGTDPDLEYRAWLTPRITEAIVQAHRNLAPARAGWSKVNLPDFVHCRRWIMREGTALNPKFTGRTSNRAQMNPGYASTNKLFQTGAVDPAVTVLSIQTAAGEPLALLANYSTHYAGAPGVSADYFGEFAREMAKRLGAEQRQPAFVAIMSNGTSGDANCIDFTKAEWKVDRFNVANAVADAASDALKRVVYSGSVRLAAVEERVKFKVRLPSKEEVAAAKAYLDEKVGKRPIKNWEENYARETTLMADWPATKELKLQALRIGDFGIAAIPCETYGTTGLTIKRHSPFDLTMVIGLANGYNGYLPPPEQHQFGGYTTWRARTSYLEVGAEPKIVEHVTALLKKAREAKQRGPVRKTVLSLPQMDADERRWETEFRAPHPNR